MGQLRRLTSYDQSDLWKRLGEYSSDERYQGSEEAKEALANLLGNVRSVANKAKYIGDQISRFLPQYTLHNERHYLNVLAIMDALVPEAVLSKMTPLECALCILAAYTHDLGMALQDEEYHAIFDEKRDTPERQRFLTYRAGFGEECRQIKRWKAKGGAEARKRIDLIEGHILANYIRVTHANEKVNRIEQWLDAIAEEAGNQKLYTYGNYDFKRDLALIGISHGKSARWLRDALNKERRDREDGFFQLVGVQEGANLAFPGLLLRLADIMDFDASRTPGILFKHIGIENETSILEWEKHLAVVGWQIRVRPKNPILKYTAVCKHPVHEKSIREFVRWIDQELKDVRAELDYQVNRLDEDDRRFVLYLPLAVDLNVRAKRSAGKPVYLYEDIEFRLDQDEIQQLLLGEALWGNPQLCIRELLQNALDAVQMRDLRLKMQEEGFKPAEPVDRLKRMPGGAQEKLEVALTWGHDPESGQDYLRVTDHGVGMTREVVEKYFTQVGKSFYRSPEFERESAALGARGFQARPISIFGIGILSSFMVADRLHVRTRPGGVNDTDRQAYDITISGPGSLFWLQEGTLDHQGTEVTLFLKPQYHLDHHAEDLLERIRKHFGYEYGSSESQDEHAIDPALIAASHVVWPLYPVMLHPPDGDPLRLDDRFHVDVLAPLDTTQILEKAQEWDCPASFIGDPEWGLWDWTDTEGDDATGSRVRLWFPRNDRPANSPSLPVDPPASAHLCRQDELAAFAEPHLGGSRTVVTVKGMYVNDVQVGTRALLLAHGVGGRVWVDLHGAAAPRLTADRQRALTPEDAETWRDAVRGSFQRMEAALLQANTGSGTLKNLKSGFRWSGTLPLDDGSKPATTRFDIIQAAMATWSPPPRGYRGFGYAFYKTSPATAPTTATSSATSTSPSTSSETSPAPANAPTTATLNAATTAPSTATTPSTATAPSTTPSHATTPTPSHAPSTAPATAPSTATSTATATATSTATAPLKAISFSATAFVLHSFRRLFPPISRRVFLCSTSFRSGALWAMRSSKDQDSSPSIWKAMGGPSFR